MYVEGPILISDRPTKDLDGGLASNGTNAKSIVITEYLVQLIIIASTDAAIGLAVCYALTGALTAH